jgi:hypothetical protein
MVTRAPAAKPAPCFSRACGVHRQPRSPTQKRITHFAPKIIREAAPATIPQSWRDRIRSACIAAVLCIQILMTHRRAIPGGAMNKSPRKTHR